MGIARFRWLIVRGRAVATRSHVRFQAVQSPCRCAERLSVASPYMSVAFLLGIPFSLGVLPIVRQCVWTGMNFVCLLKWFNHWHKELFALI